MDAKIIVELSITEKEKLFAELQELLDLASQHKHYNARFGFWDTVGKQHVPEATSKLLSLLKYSV